MVNPALAQQLVDSAVAHGGQPASDLEARARQSRLTFAATIAALKNQCPCEPCQWLRQAVDMLLADVTKEVKGDATSGDTAPGQGSHLP